MNNNNEVSATEAARARRSASMKIALSIALFFSLAWALLQWSLLAGEQFAGSGIARRFATIEAAVCGAAALAAILHLAFTAAVQAVSLLRKRDAASRLAARLPAAG